MGIQQRQCSDSGCADQSASFIFAIKYSFGVAHNMEVASVFIPEMMVRCQLRYRLEESLQVRAPVIEMNWTLLVINKLRNVVATSGGLGYRLCHFCHCFDRTASPPHLPQSKVPVRVKLCMPSFH